MDAREKLQKIRNLKDGNLEVKTVGRITLTTKVNGQLTLSTKNKTSDKSATAVKDEVQQIGRLTKTVSSSGQVSLSSKSKAGAGAGAAGMRSEAGRGDERTRSRSEGGRPAGTGIALRGAGGQQKENSRRSAGSSRAPDIDR